MKRPFDNPLRRQGMRKKSHLRASSTPRWRVRGLILLLLGGGLLIAPRALQAQTVGAPPTFAADAGSSFAQALSAPATQGIDFSSFNMGAFDSTTNNVSSLAQNPQILDPTGSNSGSQTAFQTFKHKTTYLPTDDLGFLDFEFEPVFALPSPMPNSYFVITPGFGWHLLNGPDVPDMPADVVDLYLDLRWPIVFSPSFTLDTGVTPGLYTDFDATDSDAFRLGARMAGVWQYSPCLQIVAGIAYLDRVDVDWLPIGGIIYTPNPDVLIELMSPRAKLARRIYAMSGSEQWVYVGGEFGGGSWAISRASGMRDIASYYDLRLFSGFEGKLASGASWYVEGGFVFARNLEYASATPDYEPGNTTMLRLGFGI